MGGRCRGLGKGIFDIGLTGKQELGLENDRPDPEFVTAKLEMDADQIATLAGRQCLRGRICELAGERV